MRASTLLAVDTTVLIGPRVTLVKLVVHHPLRTDRRRAGRPQTRSGDPLPLAPAAHDRRWGRARHRPCTAVVCRADFEEASTRSLNPQERRPDDLRGEAGDWPAPAAPSPPRVVTLRATLVSIARSPKDMQARTIPNLPASTLQHEMVAVQHSGNLVAYMFACRETLSRLRQHIEALACRQLSLSSVPTH